MTRTDLVAGVKHAFFLDRGTICWFAGYQALLATVTVIAGGPTWMVLGLLGLAVVPVIEKVWRRARTARESREFYLWLTAHEDDDEWADDLVE